MTSGLQSLVTTNTKNPKLPKDNDDWYVYSSNRRTRSRIVIIPWKTWSRTSKKNPKNGPRERERSSWSFYEGGNCTTIVVQNKQPVPTFIDRRKPSSIRSPWSIKKSRNQHTTWRWFLNNYSRSYRTLWMALRFSILQHFHQHFWVSKIWPTLYTYYLIVGANYPTSYHHGTK